MREIRFRAWDDSISKMIDWDELSKRSMDGHSYYGLDLILKGESHHYHVMQYTGLKDKNGKEIYESDIVRMDGKYTYEVRFEDGKFVAYHLNTHAVKGTKWGDLHRFFDPDFAEYHVEVTGNIYEGITKVS